MKTLIAYFSWSNNTKGIVEEVNKFFNFDILRIERKIPYSNNYHQCAYVEAKNEIDNHIYPEIKDINADLNDYSRILLFFPIWWYTFPMPIGSFIKKLNNYKGEVILFSNSYTNDIQYVKNSYNDALQLNSNINFKNGLFNKSINDHIDFIKNLNN